MPLDLGLLKHFDWLVGSQTLLLHAHVRSHRLSALGQSEEAVEQVEVLDLRNLGGTVGGVRNVLNPCNQLVTALSEQLKLRFSSKASLVEKLLETLLNRLLISAK